MPIAVALHGGAGTILRSEMKPDQEAKYTNALKEVLHNTYSQLSQGKTALDVVEKGVILLENCPLFNAGKGSVFTAEGIHEMDASIMDGKSRSAGAVSLVTGIKNPVHLARLVMEKTDHVFLAGPGAMEFARMMDCEFANQDYFFDQYRFDQWQSVKGTQGFHLDHSVNPDEKKPKKLGTVGVVACDQYGNIAAATSTGGMTNKRWGRIGDSPVIGSGTYAYNKTCAVSCTGSGEYFLRGVVAYDVSCLIEYKNYSLAQACREVVHQRLADIGGDGGLIAVNALGEICMDFNTEGMYRACKSPSAETIAIYGDSV